MAPPSEFIWTIYSQKIDADDVEEGRKNSVKGVENFKEKMHRNLSIN